METMGLDAAAIRRRVEETLDLFGLTPLRGRALRPSRAASSSGWPSPPLFAAGPRVLVLDEPTSALDPVAAEEVLASLHRIVHDLGVTVVLAEHRLERVVHHADRVVLVTEGRTSGLLDPAEAMATSPIYPAGRRPLPARRLVPDPPVDPGRAPTGRGAARRRSSRATAAPVAPLRGIGPATVP